MIKYMSLKLFLLLLKLGAKHLYLEDRVFYILTMLKIKINVKNTLIY